MSLLKGKTALITGGSKGIGLGIAHSLVEQGMRVVVTSRHGREAERAAARLNEMGPGRAIGIEADVRDLAAQERSVQRLLDGVIDYLPSPLEVPPVEGVSVKDGETPMSRKAEDTEPFSALAFKVAVDPFVGHITYIRCYSGTAKVGETTLTDPAARASLWDGGSAAIVSNSSEGKLSGVRIDEVSRM